MPLRAAQLLVRCGSLEELGEALERSLRRAVPFAEESALLALHSGGWGTVLDGRPLAGPLSERFGTALALELDGGKLALRVQTWEDGRPGEEERDPRPPHFRDVEAIAWELLRYLEVPPVLRLLRLDAVEVLDQGDAFPALLARAGVGLSRVAALPPARVEGGPPAEPDVVVESAAGEARALEVRSLPPGIPTEAWAEALAAVEEAQAMRLLRALCEGDEPHLPRPAFTYRSLQALRLEKLLAKARRERPWLWKLLDPDREPPLSRTGFTRLLRERLRDAPVVRAYGRHLELEAAGGCVRAPAGEAYQAYLATLDGERTANDFAERARALLQAPAGPIAAAWLLPTLLAGDPAGRAVQPLAPGLWAGLLADDGARIAPVREQDLAALGLSFDAALELALRRADELTDSAPENVRWVDLEHGRIVLCEVDDAGGAGRLLSRHARELLLAILGEPEALAAAPTRDALLACAASDTEGAAWLREEALRRFEEGPFPIHPGLWRIGADMLRPVATPVPGASGNGEGRSS